MECIFSVVMDEGDSLVLFCVPTLRHSLLLPDARGVEGLRRAPSHQHHDPMWHTGTAGIHGRHRPRMSVLLPTTRLAPGLASKCLLHAP